jgi:hypothetical protein
MQPKEDIYYDENTESVKRNQKISFWVAIILSTLITGWYFLAMPPDTPEVQRMRLFFKNNSMEVAEFIALTRDERKAYAEKKNHPFYKTYVSVNEIKRKEIKALIHLSYDYNPNRYWVNTVFLWLICITVFWFVGIIIQGAIILVRTEDEKRRALIKKHKASSSDENSS